MDKVGPYFVASPDQMFGRIIIAHGWKLVRYEGRGPVRLPDYRLKERIEHKGHDRRRLLGAGRCIRSL